MRAPADAPDLEIEIIASPREVPSTEETTAPLSIPARLRQDTTMPIAITAAITSEDFVVVGGDIEAPAPRPPSTTLDESLVIVANRERSEVTQLVQLRAPERMDRRVLVGLIATIAIAVGVVAGTMIRNADETAQAGPTAAADPILEPALADPARAVEPARDVEPSTSIDPTHAVDPAHAARIVEPAIHASDPLHVVEADRVVEPAPPVEPSLVVESTPAVEPAPIIEPEPMVIESAPSREAPARAKKPRTRAKRSAPAPSAPAAQPPPPTWDPDALFLEISE